MNTPQAAATQRAMAHQWLARAADARRRSLTDYAADAAHDLYSPGHGRAPAARRADAVRWALAQARGWADAPRRDREFWAGAEV